jgi:hypothetical protein
MLQVIEMLGMQNHYGRYVNQWPCLLMAVVSQNLHIQVLVGYVFLHYQMLHLLLRLQLMLFHSCHI